MHTHHLTAPAWPPSASCVFLGVAAFPSWDLYPERCWRRRGVLRVERHQPAGGGLPWCSDSKESACSAGDPVPSLYGKVPWRRAWQPTPVFVPGESHGQRSLVGYSPWGCKESDTTEQLTHTHTHTHTTQPAGWCPETAKSLPNKLCAFCQQQTVFVLLSIESLHSAGGIPVDGNGVISSFPRTLFCNCSPINSSSRRPQGKPLLIVP